MAEMPTPSATVALTPTATPSRALFPGPSRTVTARAIMLGDRIDIAGLERSDTLSSNPLAFRSGEGTVVVFRYGVVVLVGLSPVEEDEVLRGLRPRVSGLFEKLDDEIAVLEVGSEAEDHIGAGGHLSLPSLGPDRLLIVADALAKSTALARDERAVNAVLDQVEPFTRRLAGTGRAPTGRRGILKLIGQSLHVQHRISGRVAVEEKPDVLWDRPDLERLYARLEDEYELKERAVGLARKLDVIRETAQAMADLIDTERSLRLEMAIVLLIVSELGLTIYQLLAGRGVP